MTKGSAQAEHITKKAIQPKPVVLHNHMAQRKRIAPLTSQLKAVNNNITSSVDGTQQLPKVRRHEKAGKPSLLSTTTMKTQPSGYHGRQHLIYDRKMSPSIKAKRRRTDITDSRVALS